MNPFTGVKQPPSGRVKIVSERGETVELLYHDPLASPIDRTGGVGGWQESQRTGQPSSSWWQATPLGTATATLMLDLDRQPGAPLENRLDVLYGMGQPGGDGSDPPGLKLFGNVPTMRRQLWKLDNVETGAQFTHGGVIVQMILTLSLSELVRATGIEEVTVTSTRSTPTRPRVRTITSTQGQTLRTIAIEELGQSNLYTQLQGWNPKLAKTDPDTPLPIGTKLVIK